MSRWECYYDRSKLLVVNGYIFLATNENEFLFLVLMLRQASISRSPGTDTIVMQLRSSMASQKAVCNRLAKNF